MKDSLGLGFELLTRHRPPPGVQARRSSSGSAGRRCRGCKSATTTRITSRARVFDRLVYGFHPYGLPNSGTPESLQSLTVADLRQFHARYFAPNNAILAIVGDVTRGGRVRGRLKKMFGTWAKHDVPAVDPGRASGSDAPRHGRRQAGRRPDRAARGPSGLPRKHPDYLAFDLTMKILGGEGSSACSACCDPSAASPTAHPPSIRRSARRATSPPTPTPD